MHINLLPYTLLFADGYGRHGKHLLRALPREGVHVTPVHYGMLEWGGYEQRLAQVDWSRLTIALMSGYNVKALPGRQWVYTMWESTELPEGWAALLNRVAERVIVPCEWNVEVFRNGGVQRPIHVIGEGIDPDEFPILPDMPRTRPYTFLALGDRGMRKGNDLVYQAFHQAFRDVPDTRLLIKSRASGYEPIDTTLSNDPLNQRITLWREDVGTMADVYAQADCFVYPARSGGWELPPREAVAMGVPVIAPRHTGMVAGIDHWATVVVEKFAPTRSNLLGGHWYTCDVNAVAEAMRWCYENELEARARARQAAVWLRENQTWAHAAQDLKALIAQHSAVTVGA